MKIFQLLLLLFVCVKTYGQTNSYGRIVVEITKEKNPKRVHTKVEIKSPFRGGDSAWVKSLENEITRSVLVRKKVKKGTYVVPAKFIISKDGSTSEVQCENDPGFGMGADVVRALKKRPRWEPAAKPVEVREYRSSK